MSIKCKNCGCTKVSKAGIGYNKQRYQCKECKKVFVQGDKRVKHSFSFKLEVIKWYLEGVGIRGIERRMKVSSSLIIRWIREFSKIIKDKLNKTKVPDNIKDIQIVEIDELCTWIKKSQKATKAKEQESGSEKENTSGYGLLLIDDQIVFLTTK